MLTDNEKSILRSSHENEFESAVEGGTPWVFAVISSSGLSPKMARGVISSLVKKGLVEVTDYEGRGRSDDQIFSLTPERIEAAREVISS